MLNIIGLAIGIAVFVFIYLYIQSEIRFDRHWTDENQIYRVTSKFNLDGNIDSAALTPFRLANEFETYPEVLNSTNLFYTDPSDINDVSSLGYNDEVFEVPDITLGNSNVFKIFDYKFTEGSPERALSEPFTMVISTDVARMIFGDEPALGKKLKTVVRQYTITGVYEKQNRPSHLNFDAIVSVNSLPEDDLTMLNENWFWVNCNTYVKISDSVNPVEFERRFNIDFNRKMADYIANNNLQVDGYSHYKLEPIYDVHFNTTLLYDSPSNIDKSYLYIFGIIAAFILLTASINYINLATARSLKRAKEIGVRKVLGAYRKQLTIQYITESFILTFISFFLALALVELLMPQFNQLVNKELTLVGSLFTKDGIFFGILLILTVFVLSIISGSFPAFILSAFRPVSVLKGSNILIGKDGKQLISGGRLRKFLVTLQYFVAIGMIISTLIIARQIAFINNQDLGFDKENIIVVNVPQDTSYTYRSDDFLAALKDHPSIQRLSASGSVPGYTPGRRIFYVGDTSQASLISLNVFIIDTNFFKLLQVPILQGSSFSEIPEGDSNIYYIVNEAAVEFLNLEQAVGSQLTIPQTMGGEIIGVVRNFNFSSLHRQVEPLVFIYYPRHRYVMLKTDESGKKEALQHVKKTWKEYNKGQFLHFTFLDEKLESLYGKDQKMLSLFIYFSFFVIFISSLGLYGLSSFLIEQRTKEISIRKILGGSKTQIITLLAKDYLWLVLLAGLLVSPLVFYLMDMWLNSFAYHISINIWYFVIGIFSALLIAFLTVLIRSFYVVRRSPAHILKYE
ncbi:MAG: ABC transporter permease [Bacteroidetes bacterium]|nr:ABC transporter permease [Bacteroidota bacterium]